MHPDVPENALARPSMVETARSDGCADIGNSSASPECFQFLSGGVASSNIVGVRESWVAPVAHFEAPDGFGEETWFDELPDTLIAWILGGADIQVEFGVHRGRTFPYRSRSISLQAAGRPSRFLARAKISFGHFYLPPALFARIANDLGQSTDPRNLREELTFFADDTLHSWLNDYLVRARDLDLPPSRVEMEARAVLIIERVLTKHQIDRHKTFRGGIAPRKLRMLMDYMYERLDQDISLSELAALADLSPYHCCRAFRQSTGLPPHAWLTARRIERAQELLAASPSLSLMEVAVTVGFQTQSAFGAAFKRRVGVTPGQWRTFL